jgi:transcriptional regulator with XRE-family HTH domain
MTKPIVRASMQEERLTLGSLLGDARIAARLRQKDLGAMLSMTEDRISNIEHDKSPVTVALLMQWCAHCKADPATIIQTLQ